MRLLGTYSHMQLPQPNEAYPEVTFLIDHNNLRLYFSFSSAMKCYAPAGSSAHAIPAGVWNRFMN